MCDQANMQNHNVSAEQLVDNNKHALVPVDRFLFQNQHAKRGKNGGVHVCLSDDDVSFSLAIDHSQKILKATHENDICKSFRIHAESLKQSFRKKARDIFRAKMLKALSEHGHLGRMHSLNHKIALQHVKQLQLQLVEMVKNHKAINNDNQAKQKNYELVNKTHTCFCSFF